MATVLCGILLILVFTIGGAVALADSIFTSGFPWQPFGILGAICGLLKTRGRTQPESLPQHFAHIFDTLAPKVEISRRHGVQ